MVRRIFTMLVWLGGLALAGSVVLTFAASRVGEHRSSTYGNAYVEFQNSWGGEIEIIPPKFQLRRTYDETSTDRETGEETVKTKTEDFALTPRSLEIDSTIDYGEQGLAWLVFNAFEVHNTETYIVANETDFAGELQVDLTVPNASNIMFDYKIVLPQEENRALNPDIGDLVSLKSEVAPTDEVEIVLTYATKGMDVFRYNLSAYRSKIVERLRASIKVNTKNYELYRFGLPHKINPTDSGAEILFEIDDFSTKQDLGITFLSKQQFLDQIQTLIAYSPVSLGLFLIVVFFFSQVHGAKFHPFHYLFIAIIDVFYFLFVAYLTRFFGILPTLAISIALTVVMFLVYCPAAFGWTFSIRVVGLYLALLTAFFSLIFLMPIFRGILFVVLIFLIFMSIMYYLSRSDISQWPILQNLDEPSEPSEPAPLVSEG